VKVDTLDSTPAAAIDFDALAERFIGAMATPALCGLARGLGVSVVNLRRLRIGWSTRHGAWSFPMTGAAGRVLGIRLRKQNGRKFAVSGGREGLFLPADLDTRGRILICEGPTDTAALLDLDFAAVGRPSCTGGVRLLVELVQRYRPVDVVVVADGDGPGRRGADNLASVLTAYAPAVRVIEPPSGINDARDWMRQGTAHDDVLAAIEATPARRLQVSTRPTGRARHHGR
jgi:hypothetical protein